MHVVELITTAWQSSDTECCLKCSGARVLLDSMRGSCSLAELGCHSIVLTLLFAGALDLGGAV